MIAKRGNQWCVLHGHTQKKNSKTDKPAGSVIKCYPFNPNVKGSEASAKDKATKMHRAILISESKE